jgi:hypothetical protein
MAAEPNEIRWRILGLNVTGVTHALPEAGDFLGAYIGRGDVEEPERG